MKILEAVAAVSLAALLVATGIAGNSRAEGSDGVDATHEAAARSAVDTALAELVAVLAHTGLSSEQRLASIGKVVHEHFDVAAAARHVLGKKNKKRFSAPQWERYACEFEPYLLNYIGSRFQRYQQEQVETVRAKLGKRDVIVSARILGGQFDQSIVDFRMRESGGQWRALDVAFEGITVIKTLHSQFGEVLSARQPEGLLKWLSEQNGERSNC